MAELSDRKQQNQAFLQELERQRLNKPCLRIIDLRGKVAGECQAYQFGDRTHYLDDRAYLLVRQLMTRFDGRYTVGVHEALLSALKQLDSTESDNSHHSAKLPLMALDHPLQRAEVRIVHSTAVQLRLDDVLYHGHTIDLAVNAIRVSLKRTFSLQIGDTVLVSFDDLAQQYDLALLRKVSYQITKLEQDERYTFVVLRRLSGTDDAFSGWFKQWLANHATTRHKDIDNDLLNLQSQFYQRLWLSRLGEPLLWLGPTSLSQPLLALHVMPPAAQMLQHGKLSLSQWLEALPLQLTETASEVVAAFNARHSFSVALKNRAAVARLIDWHLNQPGSELLLLRSTRLSLEDKDRQQACDSISEVAPEAALKLHQRARQINNRVRVINLNPAFHHSRPAATVSSADLAGLQTLKSFFNADMPAPASLTSFIDRSKTRFYIHTPVTVTVADQQWQLQTLDVSADGLALKLPADAGVALNQRVYINFTRWQTLTRQVELSQIPYQVKNKLNWEGELRLGLARIKNNCPESLNRFFDWVIKENQASLRSNNEDLISSAESRLFGQALLPTLDSLPLFLGLDEEGRRQIQLIGETRDNAAGENTGLWQALNTAQIKLGELLKQANASETGSTDTTLYAYSSDNQHWTLALEQDFNSPRDKAVFVRRGLAARQFRIFRCHISALKGSDSEREADLIEQLQQRRPQRAHRVRQIRQQLSQLLGLVELSDISDVVTAFYAR